MAKTQKQA